MDPRLVLAGRLLAGRTGLALALALLVRPFPTRNTDEGGCAEDGGEVTLEGDWRREDDEECAEDRRE